MKYKKKVLIPLALFAMFSIDYKQAFARDGYIISQQSGLTDILEGKLSTTGKALMTDSLTSATNTIPDAKFQLGNTFSIYELHVYQYNAGVITGFKYMKPDGTLVTVPRAMTVGWNYINIKDLLGVDYIDATYIELTGASTGVYVAEFDLYAAAPDLTPPSAITNLSYIFGDDNSVTYTYDLPSDSDFSHIEVYQDAQLIKENHQLNSLKITGLLPETNYNFHFYSVDTSGNKSNVYSSTIQMPVGPDLIAPQNVSGMQNIVSDDTIQFSYLLPIDSDFSHLQVYRNNVLIAPNVQLASFVDEGLDYETSYTYSFKSVDTSGNVSEGTTLTVQTLAYNDLTAPSAPTGLDVISGNSSLALSWFPNPENDVQGYNVYIDGVKRNGSLIFGNSYALTNLANANEYLIQISAVDTNGNESLLTVEKSGIPDQLKIPFFKLDNDLSDVAKSTENWFSELWLVVAFSAGIPLAFIVGNRIKALFFA